MKQQKKQSANPLCTCSTAGHTKKVWKKLRLLGLILTALSATLLSSPAILPRWLLLVATILAAAGSTLTIISRSAGTNENTS